jgi:hypothetical protein
MSLTEYGIDETIQMTRPLETETRRSNSTHQCVKINLHLFIDGNVKYEKASLRTELKTLHFLAQCKNAHKGRRGCQQCVCCVHISSSKSCGTVRVGSAIMCNINVLAIPTMRTLRREAIDHT